MKWVSAVSFLSWLTGYWGEAWNVSSTLWPLDAVKAPGQWERASGSLRYPIYSLQPPPCLALVVRGWGGQAWSHTGIPIGTMGAQKG